MGKRLTTALLALLLFFSVGGCKRQAPRAVNYTPGWMVPSDAMTQPVVDNEPDSIPVSHHWKELDSSRYISAVPTEQEKGRWKQAFERANNEGAASRNDLARFQDSDHYVTVKDFIELWHREGAEIDVRQTEWRLLQWDPDPTSTPEGGFARVHRVRDRLEALMCYETGSQWDMSLYGWLWTDFMNFYIKLLRGEIESRVPKRVAQALKKESAAARRFHGKESASFELIEGDPMWSGSSFPYRMGMFGKESLGIEARANEIFLYPLMEDGRLMEVPERFASEVVLKEYERFAMTFKESEYGYSVAERQRVLTEEKAAWKYWMAQRERVSTLLSGAEKSAYDAATRSLCRGKLILLKNRYNIKNVFCPDYVAEHLASEDWPDRLIEEHNLEKLLEDE